MPLYEKMAAYNLPILLHPRRTNTTADYEGEPTSKYLVYTNFGWPYESSLAMARLAFGGPLEKFPTLKIVTHHAGGMIPYFHKRVQLSWDFNEMRMGYRHDGQTLTRSPLDYYRMFYCDTAIQGNTPALMCAYEFFGADHMVFATRHAVRQPARRARHARNDRGRAGDADRRGEQEEDLRRQRAAAVPAANLKREALRAADTDGPRRRGPAVGRRAIGAARRRTLGGDMGDGDGRTAAGACRATSVCLRNRISDGCWTWNVTAPHRTCVPPLQQSNAAADRPHDHRRLACASSSAMRSARRRWPIGAAHVALRDKAATSIRRRLAR